MLTTEQALLRWQTWESPSPVDPREEDPFDDDLTVIFGQRYTSRAVAGSPPRAPGGSPEALQLRLDGTPGTRAAHMWITRFGAKESTVDLAGPEFVLLSGDEGTAFDATDGIGVPLIRVNPGTASAWHTAYDVSPSGAVLIRPDGFVAWRADVPTATNELSSCWMACLPADQTRGRPSNRFVLIRIGLIEPRDGVVRPVMRAFAGRMC